MKQTIIFTLLFCTAATLFIYLFQRHLIYFPDKTKPVPQNFKGSDMQVVSIKTSDGLSLNSWYKPALQNQPTILYFHGNAGHIGYRMPLARQFINAGFGVLLLEYRGYGGNSGRPSEQGLYKDGRAAVHFLQQEGIQPEKLVVFGESIGTGVATKIATEYPICALVLQSPFTSLVDVARYHYPWILIKPWDRFDSLGRIKSIQSPLLIVHGKVDQIVPYEEGLTLYNQANQPKDIVTFEYKNHHDLWNYEFSNKVIMFIQKHCGSPNRDR